MLFTYIYTLLIIYSFSRLLFPLYVLQSILSIFFHIFCQIIFAFTSSQEIISGFCLPFSPIVSSLNQISVLILLFPLFLRSHFNKTGYSMKNKNAKKFLYRLTLILISYDFNSLLLSSFRIYLNISYSRFWILLAPKQESYLNEKVYLPFCLRTIGIFVICRYIYVLFFYTFLLVILFFTKCIGFHLLLLLFFWFATF